MMGNCNTSPDIFCTMAQFTVAHDGHHYLIRWKFVIHGCIDGKSRKIMYSHCSTNNLAETVLELFLSSINDNWGLWPSRIRVDYGVENVLICESMIAKRGHGRGNFIAGSSTRNQRIELASLA